MAATRQRSQRIDKAGFNETDKVVCGHEKLVDRNLDEEKRLDRQFTFGAR